MTAPALPVSQTLGLPSGSTFPVGTTTNTFSAMDAGGNTGTCSFTVTVNDTEDPVANCPANITVNSTPGQCGALVSFTVTSSDNCPGETINSVPASGTFFTVGTTPVQVTVTDAAQNDTPCSFSVTVVDNINPTAICTDPTVQLDINGNVVITGNILNEGSSDNCAIGSLTPDITNLNCSNIGPNTVTLTVTDLSGNSATCVSTVTVEDKLPPTALCQNVTVQLDNTGNGSTTAAAVTISASDACGVASLSLSQTNFTCAHTGDNTVTLTATDVNGNSGACTSIVTVVDQVPPIAICQDVTVQLDNTGNGSTTAAAVNNGSSDACGIASLSLNNSTFTCANIGSNTVTLTVNDVNINASTCTATVTVVDVIAPAAVCQDVTVQLDNTGNGSTTAGDVNNGSSDACGIAALSLDNTGFTCANVGSSNTVILTVTDDNNNSSACSATVTVVDGVAPAALCQDVTVQLDASGNGSTTAAAVNNGSSDACGIQSAALSQQSFSCANTGTNTVTLTVTDNNGNASTCTATVTVIDGVAPVAVCQDVTVQLDNNGTGSTTATAVNNGSSDACGIQSAVLSQQSFSCAN
ncbi:MAG: HYR domain-containing protein, partial [Lewinella sp.]|nr:HYR domain-containing protein [Lewinella sp.]